PLRATTDRSAANAGSSDPRNSNVPDRGRTSPAIAFSSVDFPLPLSPAIPRVRPAGTSKETESTAVNGGRPLRGKEQVIWRAARIAAEAGALRLGVDVATVVVAGDGTSSGRMHRAR